MKKILFLIFLSFSFLFKGCFPSYKTKIPYEWIDQKSEIQDFLKVTITNNKKKTYLLNFTGLIPVGNGGTRAYILKEVKISKQENNLANELEIQILPVIQYVGKQGSDYFDKIQIYKFLKKEKIKISKEIKQIKFIYKKQEKILVLPLNEKQEEIIITP